MAEKLNTIVSPEAQKAWHAADTLEKKVAVVKQHEDLRHLFYQALEIWNALPDDEPPAAPAAPAVPTVKPK